MLVVQHMPQGFTHSLAKRLDSLVPYCIKEGEHDEPIRGGTAYIAPGGQHMVIKRKGKSLYIGLNTDPPRRGHRPAVDVLLESALAVEKEKLIFCILTGMGKDGSVGLKQLKSVHPVYTIAQDEASCVVYGMPKAVVEAGLADRVVPIGQMADAIVEGIKMMGG